jgi:hypothetical protein
VGKIIGAIVGGMLVILTLCLLYWYRQHSKAHRGLHALPKCFRIRNIPQNWVEDDLQDTLNLLACDQCLIHQLSLYQSCYDSTKTALLNLNACSEHLEPPRYLPILDSVDNLEIDSDFYSLTPLNDPKSEVVVEYVFPAPVKVTAYADIRVAAVLLRWPALPGMRLNRGRTVTLTKCG